MSKEPAQRYIIKRVDGFVSVCDTQDNEAPIDNSAKGLEALLNALNTANSRLKAENEELKLQPDPLTAYLYAAELGKDAVKRLKAERVHDLNQIGGLQEENARLKADLEKSDAVVFTQAVENERLKAEVEAQAKRWAESEDLISHYKQQMDEAINDCQCSRLKAEVERLKEDNQQLQARCNFLEDKPSYE